jgi:eukaryotic-like serine/threonine-protein kinase
MLDVVLDLPPGERASYLDAAHLDPDLRRRVDDLVAAAAASDGLLDSPAIEHAAPLIAEMSGGVNAAAAAGQRVGSYRLVHELGSGGMAVVWLAEREDGQFQQQVAIKFVKQGLLSRDAQRRFLQERQILARLQHPAIAKLLDGGVTTEGTPYFVMERVEGASVTTYCREHDLDVPARLQLFLHICDAVQYAHRNLIVHRDLKPSNILVDRDGHVKLLDFGIAKLTGDAHESGGAPVTVERALTPEYAAPEQLRGEPVSTSTDVFALGVVLHEMLTGERPDPRGHTRRLRGDLDRIVLKAMHEAPERRYASAEALAADVRRHLDGLPVAARGDALSYRAGKFLGRHRIAAGAGALVLLTLVGGLVATTWQARRARLEAHKAEAVKDFLKTILAAADPEQTSGREPSIRQVLDAGAQRIEGELRDQPDVQSEVAGVIGSAYQALGEYERVAQLLQADLDRRRRIDGPRSLAVAGLLTHIADARYEQSRFDEAGRMYDEALSIEREGRGARTVQVAELLWDIAGVARNRGDLAGAESLDREALAICIERRGADSAEAVGVRESLAILYSQDGRFAEAAAEQSKVAEWRDRHLSADHPHTLNSRYNLGYAYLNLGRFEDAIRTLEDVATRQRRVLGPKHDRLAVSLRVLARALDQAGRAEDARGPIAEALEIQETAFGADHSQVAIDRLWQAVVEMHSGLLAEAERDARATLAYLDAHTNPLRADAPYWRAVAGTVLAETGKLAEADAQIARAIADQRAAHHENVFLGLELDAEGDVARQRLQFERAREKTSAALPLLERTLDPEHPALAIARVHAGAAQWSAGAPVDGERLIRAGLDVLERRYPNGHPDLASAWLTLGTLLAESGRTADGRRLIQKAAEWRVAHYGPRDPRTLAAESAAPLTKR